MSKQSKSKPIIRLRALAGSVRPAPRGQATFLDITFKCEFASGEQGPSGSNIRLSRGDIGAVVQLAEHSYTTISRLLIKQGKAQQPG
jgi:hypothetical protein